MSYVVYIIWYDMTSSIASTCPLNNKKMVFLKFIIIYYIHCIIIILPLDMLGSKQIVPIEWKWENTWTYIQ